MGLGLAIHTLDGGSERRRIEVESEEGRGASLPRRVACGLTACPFPWLRLSLASPRCAGMPARDENEPPAHRRSLLLSLSMAAMEMTVVSTAMPTVVRGPRRDSLLLVGSYTAYLLTSTVTVPSTGNSPTCTGGSPSCSRASPSSWWDRWRAGLRGGSARSSHFARCKDSGGRHATDHAHHRRRHLHLEERARMQGVFGAVWGVAGLIGPLLGGIIVKYLSWRWVFFINVPAGIASAALLAVALHEEVEHRPHSLDLPGAGLLTLGLTRPALRSARRALEPDRVAARPACLLLFVLVERRAAEPVLRSTCFASASWRLRPRGGHAGRRRHDFHGDLRAALRAGRPWRLADAGGRRHHADGDRLADRERHQRPCPPSGRLSGCSSGPGLIVSAIAALGAGIAAAAGASLHVPQAQAPCSAWDSASPTRRSSSRCRPASSGGSAAWRRPARCSPAPSVERSRSVSSAASSRRRSRATRPSHRTRPTGSSAPNTALDSTRRCCARSPSRSSPVLRRSSGSSRQSPWLLPWSACCFRDLPAGKGAVSVTPVEAP